MRYGMVLLYGIGKHQLGTCADDEDSCMYGGILYSGGYTETLLLLADRMGDYVNEYIM